MQVLMECLRRGVNQGVRGKLVCVMCVVVKAVLVDIIIVVVVVIVMLLFCLYLALVSFKSIRINVLEMRLR